MYKLWCSSGGIVLILSSIYVTCSELAMRLAGKTSTLFYWDEFAELMIVAWTVKGFF